MGSTLLQKLPARAQGPGLLSDSFCLDCIIFLKLGMPMFVSNILPTKDVSEAYSGSRSFIL
jgi:hypothetical protein